MSKRTSGQLELGLVGLPALRKAVERLQFWGAREGRKSVDYSDWLRFHSPLCSRGTEGGGK